MFGCMPRNFAPTSVPIIPRNRLTANESSVRMMVTRNTRAGTRYQAGRWTGVVGDGISSRLQQLVAGLQSSALGQDQGHRAVNFKPGIHDSATLLPAADRVICELDWRACLRGGYDQWLNRRRQGVYGVSGFSRCGFDD